MILCKKCYQEKYESWKKPFDENAPSLSLVPEYNELTQHVHIFDIIDIASTLTNNEMIEISCNSCKLQYIGKDFKGNIKIKYHNGVDITEWQNI